MNNLLGDLKIQYPILQAPMAGITTPELVAAVSNSGGLGNIGAGYLSAGQTRKFIQRVKKLTNKPFGINLFVPEKNTVSSDQVKRAIQLLDFCKADLQLADFEIPSFEEMNDFDKQIEVIIEEQVPVCSFTFGIPDEEVIKKLKNKGIFIIGTATSVKEAKAVEKSGMDAVVVQGSEAGGHRGTFLNSDSYVGLMSLIPQAVDHVPIPVIGAGGIMDGRGVVAALCLGAQAVQMGTAFLTTKESGANPLHKEIVLTATEEDLRITRAFSGKPARGVNNKFMATLKKHENDLLTYPYQNSLTKKIRSEAAKYNNKDYMSLWAGQTPRLSKNISALALVETIIRECKMISNKFNL